MDLSDCFALQILAMVMFLLMMIMMMMMMVMFEAMMTIKMIQTLSVMLPLTVQAQDRI